VYPPEVLEVFGRQMSRDQICIFQQAKNDKICKPISLKKFQVNVVKALKDRPPPSFRVKYGKSHALNVLSGSCPGANRRVM